MTSKFNIAKAPGWVEKVNDFMNEYTGSDSGWSSAGIVFSNGATDGETGQSAIKYRTFSNKSGIGFVLYGVIHVPVSSMKNASGAFLKPPFLTLPVASLPKVAEKSVSYQMPCSANGGGRVSFDPVKGTISVLELNGDWLSSAKTTETFWIDISHIFPICL